jgi:hypothetical protein
MTKLAPIVFKPIRKIISASETRIVVNQLLKKMMISLRHVWKRRVDIVLPTRSVAQRTMSVAVRNARIKSAKRAWAKIDRDRVAERKVVGSKHM